MQAFVDESRRGDTYLLAAAVVELPNLSRLRTRVRGLLLPGQREVHFRRENTARRKFVLARLAEFGARVDIYRTDCRANEERARQKCLIRLVDDLLDVEGRRLVLDTRDERNKHDLLTIRTALGKRARDSHLLYEHADSAWEPLLWIADMVVGCYGLGGDWARRTAPMIGSVQRLD
ncbi:hypothetical protein [Saccharothrix lopnurensis]|uniref:DUF3800 domain-containing protein n=1 Tax=Saccharothrix lopnurensis TaxID=1670621 RepID=A0ABW1P772_9PSEU